MKPSALWLSLLFLAVHPMAKAELQWGTSLPEAQAKAKKENKLVLVNFTGSDWCSWCKKLQKEVFSTTEFDQFAKNNLVLVEIDFPRDKKQSEALKSANEALKEKYQATGGFPTILFLDGDGKELGRQVGYAPGGPKAWIDIIKGVKKS